MSEIALQIENLSKQYKIGLAHQRHDTLREHLSHSLVSFFRRNGAQHDEETFWALKDVSFDVRQGDMVGIIGRNGAGKSTLLKILSRITAPTEGQVDIFGRVGSLLEVGTGFHPELSGRENIYLNGAILGMKKTEIDRKFDEIVSFSEIERFIDTPVKRYSSGMYVRLAFAVAAHMEPEVLIVDEVLAVGDTGFQKKCLGKMEGVAKEGRTILFVSHNMAAVEHLCNKALMLDAGRVVFSGSSKEAVDYYVRSFSGENGAAGESIVDLRTTPGRPKKFRPVLNQLELLTHEGKPLNGRLSIGAPLRISVSFRLEEPTSQVDVSFLFDNDLGQRIFIASSAYQPNWSDEKRIGDQTFVCDIPSLTLVPGEYKITIKLLVALADVDYVEHAARLTIQESDYYGTGRLPRSGLLVIKQHWHSDWSQVREI